MRSILLLQVLGFALAGCTGPASATDLPANENATGRKLYVAKCAKCHKFYDPARYSDEEWKGWMAKMSKKSKLNAEQEAALSQYIENNLRTPDKRNNALRSRSK